MGMPGSETALEEIMSHVSGEFIHEGFITKIVDDLYMGGDSEDELVSHWLVVLQALSKNNLGLSSLKTVIAPKFTTVLGWVWQNGSLRASQHHIAAIPSVKPHKTVHALCSFTGPYKIWSHVLQDYADKMLPLDSAVAGKQSHDHITWTEELLKAFRSAQHALNDCNIITLPHPSDTLCLVTDASVKECGLWATLYGLRDDKLHLAGFFSAPLRKHQVTWLPCEVEALAIATVVNHFVHYILQANQRTHVLTDCRPCVLEYQKLCCGEFSNSTCVTAFLSTISRFQLTIDHLVGAANLPSDFASPNPLSCPDDQSGMPVYRRPSGGICPFNDSAGCCRGFRIYAIRQSPSMGIDPTRLPWFAQSSCALETRYPTSEESHKCTRCQALPTPSHNRILGVHCGPCQVLVGLITAIHIKFNIPSPFQTKRLMNKYFLPLIWTKLLMRYPCPVTPALLSNPSPKLWSHIRHQSLPLPLDPHFLLTSLSDGNNASSPYVKLSHHILSQLSMTVNKVMTSQMQSVHYVQMPGTWVTCAGYVLTQHLGWYLYYTMPLSNVWVSFLRRGTRKNSTKIPSQSKRLRNLVWNFTMSKLTMVLYLDSP